ncbi:DegV family protein [Halothermothrix orenii]|uniref:DegV family protein n=1 Tax=Halothermothrix orenii (strain H 168 / OCM 544 / DSM 9562) TaxID=373903 RepID=B8D1W8_HALOH|nr:DegV family protein [Halothermothrix orenii]ACL69195.1 degV family protein [Halothermothrix orenii H 168]
MSTKIIVDSACDLPDEILDKYEIEVLPFNIHIDNQCYKDGIDIEVEELYAAMKEGKVPKTSQVSPEDFKRAFSRNAEAGNDCIYISFSAKLSGANQTGQLVAKEIRDKYKDVNIDIVDSKAGSVATGIIAYKAALLLEKGVSREKVIEKIKYWADHIEHIFMLDDLKPLVRGGRISKTKFFVGNILNIKPILCVKNGKIELLKKVRGTGRAISKMINYVKEKSYDLTEQLIGIAHADDLVQAEVLKEKIEELGGKIFCVEKIGSVLGVHLGIGGIGVFFLNEAEA